MNTSGKNESPKPQTARDKWRHAFAVGEEFEEKLTAEEQELLDDLASAIVKKRLAAPALLWFISMKPLNFLGASILQAGQFVFKELALEVFIKNYFTSSFEHGLFVSALEKRTGVDYLIDKIQNGEDDRVAAAKLAKTEQKNDSAEDPSDDEKVE